MHKVLWIALFLSSLFILSSILPAFADTTFNDELATKPIPLNITHDHIFLVYSSPAGHFEQGRIMTFVVKAIDTKTVTDFLPYDIFTDNQGNLNNANINVTLADSYHNTLFKWTGKTNQFGLYVGSLRLLNYPTHQEYYLIFSAQKAGMYNYTTSTYFELYDQRDYTN